MMPIVMTNKSKSNDSLCEKSMQVVINMIKLSSSSLVRMNPQAPATSFSSKNTRPTSNKTTRSPSLTPQFRRSVKSHELQKPVSYLLEPVDGHNPTYVIHDQQQSVDEVAEDYIGKVYGKIRSNGSNETSNFSAYVQSPRLLININ